MKLRQRQVELVLNHLHNKGSITPAEALVAYSCMRLAARIKDLRDLGHIITTTMKTDATGTRYASYSLGVAS